MKRIVLLATGGTIACRQTPDGLTPALRASQMLHSVPFRTDVEIIPRDVFSMDSSNIQPEEWSILASAVGKSFAGANYNKEMLLAGYRAARDTSFARAAFSVRMLQMFIPSNEQDRASFLLGAVLESDVAAVKNSKALSVTPDMKMVIAGKEPLASALKLLFEEDGYFRQVEIYYPEARKPMSGYGLYQIAMADK